MRLIGESLQFRVECLADGDRMFLRRAELRAAYGLAPARVPPAETTAVRRHVERGAEREEACGGHGREEGGLLARRVAVLDRERGRIR